MPSACSDENSLSVLFYMINPYFKCVAFECGNSVLIILKQTVFKVLKFIKYMFTVNKTLIPYKK